MILQLKMKFTWIDFIKIIPSKDKPKDKMDNPLELNK
jgi:hypothetical protein